MDKKNLAYLTGYVEGFLFGFLDGFISELMKYRPVLPSDTMRGLLEAEVSLVEKLMAEDGFSIEEAFDLLKLSDLERDEISHRPTIQILIHTLSEEQELSE